jgi:iron complex outermembrane receptor protein
MQANAQRIPPSPMRHKKIQFAVLAFGFAVLGTQTVRTFAQGAPTDTAPIALPTQSNGSAPKTPNASPLPDAAAATQPAAEVMSSKGKTSNAETTVTGVEQIMVTARRHAEKLQDVPLSISAFSSQTLEDAGVKTLQDLTTLTPGLTINATGAETKQSPNIRGQVNLNTAGDPNVAIFLDGVYLANPSTIDLGLIDMERIEVVKGPVSALYGRNAYAGAINYVSKTPTDKLSGEVTAGVSSYGGNTATASLNIPIKKDVLSTHISLATDHSQGSNVDHDTGGVAGGYSKKDGQFTFLLTPTHKLSIQGSAYYGYDTFKTVAQTYLDGNCGTVSANAATRGQYTLYCGEISEANGHGVQVDNNLPSAISGSTRHVLGTSLHATYDLGWSDLSGLYGFNRTTQQRFDNFSGSANGIPFLLSNGNLQNLQEFFGQGNNDIDNSLEMRLSSKQDQRIRWAGGANFFNAQSQANQFTSIDGSTLPAGVGLNNSASLIGRFYLTPDGSPAPYISSVDQTDRIYSEFLSTDIDILPRLTLSLEGRHTHEEKSQDVLRTGLSLATNPLGGTTYASYDFYNYRASLRYKVSLNSMVYASVANGTKAGGFNSSVTIASEQSYAPQRNTTFELGGKASFFDNRLSVNAAAYHIEATNLQLLGPSSDPTNPGFVTKNFGQVNTNGFELGTSVVPYPGVTVNAGLGYTDPKFQDSAYDYSANVVASCALISSCASRVKSVQQPNGTFKSGVALAGLTTPFTSKVTFSLGTQIVRPLVGNWDYLARMDFRYESKQYATEEDQSYWGARKTVNLRFGIQNEKYALTFFVTNLTDDQTPTAAEYNTRLSDLYSTLVAYLPQRRTFGLTGSYRF